MGVDFIGSPEFWIIAVIIFGALESLTMGLTSLWFAAGAMVAFLAALIGLPMWVQIGLFIVSTSIFMIYTRPIVKNHLKVGLERTNIDRLIGMEGIVTAPVEKFKTGQVKVNGQVWTAEADGDDDLGVGITIEVVRIEGVKLIVREKEAVE